MTTPKKPGRPPEAGEARDQFIRVRATAGEVRQFETLGGAAWLRRVLKHAFAKLKNPGT